MAKLMTDNFQDKSVLLIDKTLIFNLTINMIGLNQFFKNILQVILKFSVKNGL